MSTGAAGAAGAAESIGLYYMTPPWSSQASMPVTHALDVVLNRRAVRLLPCVCLCFFLSLSILVCRLILFERSEFLIDTSHKKKSARLPVCRVHVSNNLGFSVKKLSWF